MNIFWLDEDLEKAAQYHNDRHLNKMLTESVQILCTALAKHCKLRRWEHPKYLEMYNQVPYKPTHPGHPVVVWAGFCTGNFKQLTLLATKLANEWEYRFNKPHKSGDRLRELLVLTRLNSELPFDDHIASRPPMCAKEWFTPDPSADIVSNYREYYREMIPVWAAKPKPLYYTYTNREVPVWLLT